MIESSGERIQGPPRFPHAPQPSIIRAEQKDEVYLQQLTDSCYETIRRLLGPRRALVWSREIQLLSELLYYTITTGTGLQTLGEEYCDILQATGAIGVDPGITRRGVMVLLHCLTPYLQEKATQTHDETSLAWQAAIRQRATAAVAENNTGQEPIVPTPCTTTNTLPNRMKPFFDALHIIKHRAHTLVHTIGKVFTQAYHSSMYHPLPNYLHQLHTAAQSWRRYESALETLSYLHRCIINNTSTLLRMHLALFYIFGVYYQLSKRMSGVYYLYQGKLFRDKPQYRALGYVLLLQIVIAVAMWARRSSDSSALSLHEHREGDNNASNENDVALPGGNKSDSNKHRPAALLVRSEAHAPGMQSPEASAKGLGFRVNTSSISAQWKCPLCLSQRNVATATTCGHVFCWTCIAEWTSQKPECPLCRAEALPSNLVVVRHADF